MGDKGGKKDKDKSQKPGGIHPQCAMEQADEPRAIQLRNAGRAGAQSEKSKPQVHKKVQPAETPSSPTGGPSSAKAGTL